jgi:hypothetical protein
MSSRALSAVPAHNANISCGLSPRLTGDPPMWAIAGDSEASRILTHRYRAPCMAPGRV